MKRITLLFVPVGLALLLGAGCTSKTVNSNTPVANTNVAATQSVNVAVTIDMGNASPVRTFRQSVPAGTTALAVLQQVGTEHNIPVVTKRYDFGDLVTSIGGLAATGTKFWIFLVNGEKAAVGAGTYQVQEGDTIGFRFGSGG